MARIIPDVSDGRLWGDQLPGGASIPLDSPAWFAWLEAPTTTSFTYALYNRQKGYIDGFVIHKIYLGRSLTLTQAHLEAVATRLRTRDGPAHVPTTSTQSGRKFPGDDVAIRVVPPACDAGT